MNIGLQCSAKNLQNPCKAEDGLHQPTRIRNEYCWWLLASVRAVSRLKWQSRWRLQACFYRLLSPWLSFADSDCTSKTKEMLNLLISQSCVIASILLQDLWWQRNAITNKGADWRLRGVVVCIYPSGNRACQTSRLPLISLNSVQTEFQLEQPITFYH